MTGKNLGRYEWLKTIGPLPAIVDKSLDNFGIHEVPGKGSNSTIMDMAKRLKVDKIYTDDDMSWCALDMCDVLLRAGKEMKFTDYGVLRAASFLKYGKEINKQSGVLSDIAIFQRPGGNHVGTLIAYTKDRKGNIISVHVLGGNQGNAKSIVEIDYIRLIGLRRVSDDPIPTSVKQYLVDSLGNMSANES